MYLISYLGNRGFKRENLKKDFDLFYHNAYMIACILGLVVHNFFYSILVSSTDNVPLITPWVTTNHSNTPPFPLVTMVTPSSSLGNNGNAPPLPLVTMVTPLPFPW